MVEVKSSMESSFFNSPHFDDHEQIVFCCERDSGLHAIIAIHSTKLGPALGGCRMWNYAADADAIADVMRLSRGMTYKNALANLPYGGGKSVIIGDARRHKTADMMRALGRHVNWLGGRYIIAEDVGTNPDDMAMIAEETPSVRGVRGVGFDPSPATAFGTFCGIKAAVRERLGKEDLRDVRVAVQGLGHVGFDLARQLHEAGAQMTVTDINDTAVEKARDQMGAQPVGLEEIYAAEVDVFTPCALGAVINDATLPRLKATVVAGSANNQLAEEHHGDALASQGILYAPDYVINAGGVIHIHHEGPHYDRREAFTHVGRIAETLQEIFSLAHKDGIATHHAADRLAEARLAA